MAVKFVGESYDFPPANMVENYNGIMNVYVVWDHHLMYCAPNAYPTPANITFRDFVEQMLRPDYRHHPDAEKADFESAEWQMENEPWTPDFDKTLEENGIAHCSFIRVKTPGLEGMHGVGN